MQDRTVKFLNPGPKEAERLRQQQQKEEAVSKQKQGSAGKHKQGPAGKEHQQ